jgi:hypothetical protein
LRPHLLPLLFLKKKRKTLRGQVMATKVASLQLWSFHNPFNVNVLAPTHFSFQEKKFMQVPKLFPSVFENMRNIHELQTFPN